MQRRRLAALALAVAVLSGLAAGCTSRDRCGDADGGGCSGQAMAGAGRR